MSLLRASSAMLACALLGCEWSAELQSDPASWAPAHWDAPQIDAADTDAADTDADAGDPCYSRDLPTHNPTLRTSTATGFSHLAGGTCLLGCHAELDGDARTKFVAAGTVYRSQTSMMIDRAGGLVRGVGGTDLPVDRCGNFYAVVGALAYKLEETQPYVENPTVHRMEKSLAPQNNVGVDKVEIPNLGSCNHSDCHDFSSKLKWGIYY